MHKHTNTHTHTHNTTLFTRTLTHAHTHFLLRTVLLLTVDGDVHTVAVNELSGQLEHCGATKRYERKRACVCVCG